MKATLAVLTAWAMLAGCGGGIDSRDRTEAAENVVVNGAVKGVHAHGKARAPWPWPKIIARAQGR
jgi:hypothetical protein